MTPISRDMDASRSRKGTANTLSLMMREDARAGSAPQTPIARSIEDVRPGKDEYDERNRLLREDIEAGGNNVMMREEIRQRREEKIRREAVAAAGIPSFIYSTEKDTAIVYGSSMLNLETAQTNREACCNLYSATLDGKTVYFIGDIFMGELDNVIAPYMTYAKWEREDMLNRKIYDLEDITFVTFMHSHPNAGRPNDFSGLPGDALVAGLLGSIMLSSPHGLIAELTDSQLQNGRYWNPPTKPYNNLHSVDTTGLRSYSTPTFKRDLWKVAQDVFDRYMDRIQTELIGQKK